MGYEEYFNKGDYENTLISVKKAIGDDNTNVNNWILISKIYIALKDFKQASSSTLIALNYDSNNGEIYFLRSKALIGLTRYKDALSNLKKALTLDKNNQDYQRLYVNVQSFMGDTDYGNILNVTDTDNLELLKYKKLNSNDYQSILDNIMGNVKIDSNLSIYDKLENLVSCFAEIRYKSQGEENGLYSCNVIQIDTRQKTIQKIATLIHELAHHLLVQILTGSLMYIYNSPRTSSIEAFAEYCLNFKDENRLFNEYCAHRVENHFMPYRYDNYESFNKIIRNSDLNIEFAVKLGNAFSKDIIYMLDKVIDFKLKNEIKKQYFKDTYFIYSFKGSEYKSNASFDVKSKFDQINLIFTEALIHVETHSALDEVMAYTVNR